MSTDIGIDLGTSSVIIFVKNKGIVLREPSVVAKSNITNEIFAYGKEAYDMIGKTPDDISIIRPLKDGVISDFHATTSMLKHYIKEVDTNRFLSTRIMICVPSQISEVERRAVIDTAMQAGNCKRVYLIEEPVASAIGAGIEIQKPNGNLVIDIGGGTTDIAVIAVGDSVVNSSIQVAGNTFDEEIKKYLKKKYGLLIGDKTAERIKQDIGCVFIDEKEIFTFARGRNLVNSLPMEIQVSSNEMPKVFCPLVDKIVDEIKVVLEKTPPELVEDITEKGIYMTGGGSLISGIDLYIERSLGIKVMRAHDAISCVALGTGKALNNLNMLEKKANR